jgi:hypothetical protein
LQNYRVVEGYIKKKIQYSLLNNIDKEDKTSAYNIPVPIAIPPSSIEYGYVSLRLPELTDSICSSGGK